MSLSLSKRKTFLEGAISGELNEFLQNHILSEFPIPDDPHQKDRMIKSVSSQIPILPDSRGIYVAYPESQDSEKPYILSVNPYSCTCGDFMYNCDYINGQYCKHIWKLQVLLSLQIVPPRTALPNLWTLAQLENDIKAAQEESAYEIASEIRKLQTRISEKPWYDIDYLAIYQEWFEILDQEY